MAKESKRKHFYSEHEGSHWSILSRAVKSLDLHFSAMATLLRIGSRSKSRWWWLRSEYISGGGEPWSDSIYRGKEGGIS